VLVVKRFVEEVPIRSQDLSTGAAQGILSLTQKLEGFKQQTDQLISAVETKRGREEAALVPLEDTTIQAGEEKFSITAQPKKKEVGFFEAIITGGAATKQYNKSLQTSYLASLGNDTREALKAIEAENPDNVGAYNEKVGGYVSGVLKEVDPSARNQVAQFMDNQVTDGRIRVQQAAIARQQEISDIENSKAIEGASDAAVRAAREGNQVAAGEALIETKAIMDSFVGQPGIDQEGVDFAFSQIQKKVAVEGIRTAVRTNASRKGGIAETAKLVREFRENPLKGFTTSEQEDIYKTLVADLNSVVALRNKEEDGDQEFVDNAQEQKSSELYLGVLGGAASAGDVTSALGNKEINQTQATKLLNLVQTRGQGIDDWTLINLINEEIRADKPLDEITDIITTNTGSRLTSATASSLLDKVVASKDEESPLKKNDVRRAEDFITSSMRVTGPLGSLDSEAEKRLADARRLFADRVLAGEDPFEVADGLVDTDQLTRAPRPLFGNKEDLDTSLNLLNDALQAGSIDDETYNREWNNIERLKQLKENIEAFNKAKKEHFSGI